jgi:hypothetical protein
MLNEDLQAALLRGLPISAEPMTRSGTRGSRRRGAPRARRMIERRTARRQWLVRHLHRCGERPVFEALLAVEAGQSLDEVLEDFARLSPDVYKAVGADILTAA